MDFIVGTGKSITVRVDQGSPGKWSQKQTRREVCAIGYEGGETKVLVIRRRWTSTVAWVH